MTVQQDIGDLKVGDEVGFTPDNSPAWWRVAARNDAHVVLVRQSPHGNVGVMDYTVTGTIASSYNGQGPGPVRSSLNSLGGGWGVGPFGELAHTIIEALESGTSELSMRRVLSIREVGRRGV